MSELVRSNIKDIYRMSPTQEGMYFHYLLDKTSLAYFQQTAYRLTGNLNLELVKKSLEELFRRYDILRTVFNHEKVDVPLQVVLKEREVVCFQRDLTDLPEKMDREQCVQTYKESDKRNKFDLSKDVLMRLAVFRVDEQEYEFVWSFHHILMDGWCVEILVADFLEIYDSLLHERNYSLPSPMGYRTYIEWLERQNRDEAADYWKRYLVGFKEITEIPKCSSLLSSTTHRQNQVRIELKNEFAESLRKAAKLCGVTLSTLMKAAWSILLAKYNQKQETVFGVVVSGRPPQLPGIEQMVGLFINTIPVRITLNNEENIQELLQRIQAEAAEAEPFHFYPLAEIQANSSLKQNLFDHIFVFENFPMAERLNNAVHCEKVDSNFAISEIQSFERTNYNFNIVVAPGESIAVLFDFNDMVHDRQMVQAIANSYEWVLRQVAEDPQMMVGEIEWLSSKDIELLKEFNNTDAPYPADRTIHGLFEDQAAKTPDEIACICGDITITYRELNNRSNQLAYALQSLGVRQESVVGLMADRSIEMMVGVMAILKAGAAYLPLDVRYPQERIAYMLEDADVSWVLTDMELVPFQFAGVEAISLNRDYTDAFRFDNPNIGCKPDQLAYVIYTSGSTGKPKGVMVEHSSVVNRLHWMQKAYPLEKQDTLLQKTSLIFDVSVWELFWWFLGGAKLYLLPPGAEGDPRILADTVQHAKVTIIHFVPSMLMPFLEYIENEHSIGKLAGVKRVIVSGETLTEAHVLKFNKTLYATNKTLLTNLYGPTEATVDVSGYDLSPGEECVRIPIGKPIQNTRFYIVDQNKIQPVGVPGELYIAGAGLARGYLNLPSLTEGKFVPGFSGIKERMYRSGDLARWLPDGNVEYLGRIDHQVKIRGFRIELEDIESALLGFSKISQAVVTLAENEGNKKLIAYFVPKQEFSISEIREYLRNSLPEYMIPGEYIEIHEIPLTASGKSDRKRLQNMTGKRLEISSPQSKMFFSETEKIVARIWEEVLHTSEIGPNDNFFDLNGTSLDVIKVTSKLKKAFSREFDVISMFIYPTIALFCKHVLQQPEENSIDDARDAVLQAANTRMLGNVAKFKRKGSHSS